MLAGCICVQHIIELVFRPHGLPGASPFRHQPHLVCLCLNDFDDTFGNIGRDSLCRQYCSERICQCFHNFLFPSQPILAIPGRQIEIAPMDAILCQCFLKNDDFAHRRGKREQIFVRFDDQHCWNRKNFACQFCAKRHAARS